MKEPSNSLDLRCLRSCIVETSLEDNCVKDVKDFSPVFRNFTKLAHNYAKFEFLYSSAKLNSFSVTASNFAYVKKTTKLETLNFWQRK